MKKGIFKEDEGWAELLLLGGALEVGVFQFLSERKLSAFQMAEGLGCDHRATEVVLEALVDIGYLDKKKDLYSLSSRGKEEFLDRKNPKYRADSLLHRRELVERWLEIPNVIKTGKPVRRKRSPEGRKHFIGAMAEGARKSAPQVISLCLKEALGVKKVLDLGGGPGVYAQAFAEKGLDVIIQDLPEVVNMVRKTLTDEKRIQFFGADFNISLPKDSFDLVFLGNITHIYGPEENLSLFRRLRKIVNSPGYLAILDFVRDRSPNAPLFAVNMLVNTDRGGTWTEAQYDKWFALSGFDKVSLYDLNDGEKQVILARKQD